MSPQALTASGSGLRLLAHHDLGGHGDGMQVIRHGDALYVGHTGTSGMGTTILDVADPARPVPVSQWRARLARRAPVRRPPRADRRRAGLPRL